MQKEQRCIYIFILVALLSICMYVLYCIVLSICMHVLYCHETDCMVPGVPNKVEVIIFVCIVLCIMYYVLCMQSMQLPMQPIV